MIEGKHEFQVSVEELEYLKQLTLPSGLAGLLESQEGTNSGTVIVRLGRAEAEQLREYLTTQLAAIGFDENYSPNVQGQKLENLIDRFYLR
jgi:hypothetical protein